MPKDLLKVNLYEVFMIESFVKKIGFWIILYLAGFYSGFQYRGSADVQTAVQEHVIKIKDSATDLGSQVIKKIKDKPVDEVQ